nr:hypothetical protein [Candidatus Sigynarchaeota archaeon]
MFGPLEIVIFNMVYVGLAYGSIIFQKAGAMKAPKFGEEKSLAVLKGMIKNKTWLLGIIFNVIAIPYSMFLFSISSLSFVQIFNRVGIVLIFIYAFKVLKEKITSYELLGLVISYAGFILTIFDVQVETTINFTRDAESLVFFLITIVVCVFIISIYNREKRPKVKEIMLSVGAAMAGLAGSLALKIIPRALGRDLGQPDYIFNLFNFPELGRIMIGFFLPGSGYFLGSIYFYLYMTSFTFNFFLLMMMYQHGRAAVAIPLNNSINFLGLVIFGYFMFEERIAVVSWIGIFVMIVGIFLASKIETSMITAEKKGTSLDSATVSKENGDKAAKTNSE